MSTRPVNSSDDAVHITPLANAICETFDRILRHPNMLHEVPGGWPFRPTILIQKQLFEYWVDNYKTVPAGEQVEYPSQLVLTTPFNEHFLNCNTTVSLDQIHGAVDDVLANVDAHGVTEPWAQRTCSVKVGFVSLLIKDMFQAGVVVPGDR
ncbi:hypothetical protein ACHAPJ_003328 [Fusarium lateritium]